MELLKVAVLIVLLTATSAAPRGFRRHHDADIPEQRLLDAFHRFISDTSIFAGSSQSGSSQSGSSQSDSSQSDSSEESKITLPDVTPRPVTPRPVTPRPATSPAMTTVEEGSSGTPEVSTNQPIVMETTVAPETPTPSDSATTACDGCFTVVIPTAAPITDNRGDN